jgi:hypothetical protein
MGGVLFHINGGLPFLIWGAIMAILLVVATTFLKAVVSKSRTGISTAASV